MLNELHRIIKLVNDLSVMKKLDATIQHKVYPNILAAFLRPIKGILEIRITGIADKEIVLVCIRIAKETEAILHMFTFNFKRNSVF